MKQGSAKQQQQQQQQQRTRCRERPPWQDCETNTQPGQYCCMQADCHVNLRFPERPLFLPIKSQLVNVIISLPVCTDIALMDWLADPRQAFSAAQSHLLNDDYMERFEKGFAELTGLAGTADRCRVCTGACQVDDVVAAAAVCTPELPLIHSVSRLSQRVTTTAKPLQELGAYACMQTVLRVFKPGVRQDCPSVVQQGETNSSGPGEERFDSHQPCGVSACRVQYELSTVDKTSAEHSWYVLQAVITSGPAATHLASDGAQAHADDGDCKGW